MSEGYFFVPLPSHARRTRRLAAVHDRSVDGTIAGTFTIVLSAEQPIHVGSGFKALHEQGLVRRSAYVGGGPGVPGASFKGLLRSRYEAITLSCAPPPKPDKVRSQSHRDVKWAAFTREVVQHDVFRTRACDHDLLCPACALFGRMSLQSRVTITDLARVGEHTAEILEMPEQFSPNLHHVGTFRIVGGEFEIGALKGRKFAGGQGPVAENARYQQVEAIPRGARLRGTIRVRNVTAEEMGGLLCALGRVPASALKLGGGKAHGFGRARVEELTFSPRGRVDSKTTVDEGRWREAFERSPDRWEEGERELVRVHQGDV